MISIEDFKKIELKIGNVLAAERVEGSEKLVKLSVDLGEESPRQVLAGVAIAYVPEALVGRQIVVVANLEPRKLMGMESNGMLLAVESDEGPVLLAPSKSVTPGAKVR
ncbi:MAG: methionine--tRNA ligase subunit beta [Candidatus Brennerbacteria bacterium]|nr:methionine--tRNA ligase subunit beta [Candidatus Brennerbacteria bacterium]